MPEVKCDEMLM